MSVKHESCAFAILFNKVELFVSKGGRMSEEKVTDTQSVGSVPQQLRDGWQTISLSQAGMDTFSCLCLPESEFGTSHHTIKNNLARGKHSVNYKTLRLFR